MDPKTAVKRAVFLFIICLAIDSLILAVIGLLLKVTVLIVIPCAVALSALWILFIYRKVDSLILKKVNAKPLQTDDHHRFSNLVDGVCVAYGFRHPQLYVIEDVAPNMMMIGRDSQHSSLVVTTGLLDRVQRTELEGLITHELSRSRNRISFLEGAIAILVVKPWNFMPKFVSLMGDKLIDPWAVAQTDIAAVALTRYPPGLAQALTNLGADGREPTYNPKFCRHMWVNPPKESLICSGFSTNERIAALAEL